MQTWNSKFGREARTALMSSVLVVFGFMLACSADFALAKGSPNGAQAGKSDRWIHVRVLNKEAKGETVRVNVPLDLAEKVLPTINHRNFHNGRVTLGGQVHDVDLRALLEAVRSSRDGEFVTVNNNQNDVRVAKQGSYLVVHVQGHGDERAHRAHRVEVRMPLTVVNALLSGSKDELDLVAGLRALSTQPDVELVTVEDGHNSVRVWLDSKNATD
ncbi:MAG TPA: hypothetical protein VOA41_03775 [Candidatus Dormibacteraeota bacterium]|nr:hypothetical protein [Candidatus Dormibacteraeota bacterium]